MEAGSASGPRSELAFRPSLEGNRSRETSGLLQAEKRYFVALVALQAGILRAEAVEAF